MIEQALLVILPIIAAFALTRRRRLAAVVAMGVYSLIISAVYAFAGAPDVAITEAAIGAALVTFIYILAIRKTGRLVVIGDSAPGLLFREGDRILGLEYEILSGFARHLGLDLVVRFLPRTDVEEALLRGDGDIGAGGIVDPKDDERLLITPGHLPTALFHLTKVGQPPGEARDHSAIYSGYFSDLREAIQAGAQQSCTLDLARFLAVSRSGLSDYSVDRSYESHLYSFVVPEERSGFHSRLVAYLERAKGSGELDRLIRRHFP